MQSKKFVVKLLCLSDFRKYFDEARNFFDFGSFFKELCNVSKLLKFDVLLAINNFFSMFIRAFRRFSKQILEMLFPRSKPFFLACSS